MLFALCTASSASADAASAWGRIVDAATGAPIAGATIVIGSALYAGATPPPAGSALETTSRHDGSFSIGRLRPSSIGDWSWSYISAALAPTQNAQWLEVFPPRGDSHVPYHGLWSIRVPGTSALGSIALIVPTNYEREWLMMLNHDRANVGVPARTAPLIFDETTLLAARRWARYMAENGWYAHVCPERQANFACVPTWQWEILNHGFPSAQNILYGPASWVDAQRGFMSGRLKCAALGDYRSCAYTEETGHYINLMSATTWAGLGEAVAPDGVRYYDEEFTAAILPGVYHQARSASR